MNPWQRVLTLSKKFWQTRFRRFVIVGGSVTLLGAVLLDLLVRLGLTPEWANFIQAVVSVETNFFWNNWWTWKDRKDSTLLMRWWKFHIVKLFVTIPLNQLLFVLMVNVSPFLRDNYVVAYFINIAIVMVINFIMNELFVFKKATPADAVTEE